MKKNNKIKLNKLSKFINDKKIKNSISKESGFKNTINTIKKNDENIYEFFSNFNLKELSEKEIYENFINFYKKYNKLKSENWSLNFEHDLKNTSEEQIYREINRIHKDEEENGVNIKYSVVFDS